jgi:hypothetical protein
MAYNTGSRYNAFSFRKQRITGWPRNCEAISRVCFYAPVSARGAAAGGDRDTRSALRGGGTLRNFAEAKLCPHGYTLHNCCFSNYVSAKLRSNFAG